MILEVHDGELPTLSEIHRSIDYEYQAEEHVLQAPKWATRFVLFLEDGSPLREWHVNADGKFDKVEVTPGTVADPRSMLRWREADELDAKIKAGLVPAPVPSIVVTRKVVVEKKVIA